MANVGRPPIWKTADELQEKIDEYFSYCKDNDETPNIAGLAYFCGVSRETIYNYSEKDQFFDTLKKARDYVMYRMESRAIDGGAPAGTIFLLKNYGYSDRYENVNENTHKIERIEIDWVGSETPNS